MNAPALRLATPEPSLGQSLAGMWDPECERAILGAAMLAEPLPVHRARPRRLGLVNWRHRKLKPLWYRALRSRGSLRRAA